jgi:hypothetical protein
VMLLATIMLSRSGDRISQGSRWLALG